MARLTRQQRYAGVAVVTLCVAPLACNEEVSLGAWGPLVDTTSTVTSGAGAGPSTSTVSSGGTGGSAGAPGTDGPMPPPPVLPGCLEAAEPGPVNAAGLAWGATETATDWTWPAPHTSLQFELMVEREIERDPLATTRGYYWAHQFSFVEGVTGWFGIQAEGVYQSDPDATREVTKMAAFWLSGPPLNAELGDIAFPDARIADITASGVTYTTIHAKFDWQVCRVYRLRIAQESVDEGVGVWYGAWIEDVDAEAETFLGRMLLPADSGAFSTYSTSRTLPIEFGEPDSCEVPQGSALFGIPHTVEADAYAAAEGNRFAVPMGCPSSRFTDFPGAVRHEQGVGP